MKIYKYQYDLLEKISREILDLNCNDKEYEELCHEIESVFEEIDRVVKIFTTWEKSSIEERLVMQKKTPSGRFLFFGVDESISFKRIKTTSLICFDEVSAYQPISLVFKNKIISASLK